MSDRMNAIKFQKIMAKIKAIKKDATTQTDVDFLCIIEDLIQALVTSPQSDSEIGACSSMNRDSSQKSGDFTQEGTSAQKDQMSDTKEDQSVEDEKKISSTSVKETWNDRRERILLIALMVKSFLEQCDNESPEIIINNETEMTEFKEKVTGNLGQLLHDIAASDMSRNEKLILTTMGGELKKLLNAFVSSSSSLNNSSE